MTIYDKGCLSDVYRESQPPNSSKESEGTFSVPSKFASTYIFLGTDFLYWMLTQQ